MVGAEFWPTLFAGVAAVVIGMIWYNPKVFGTSWMLMSNLRPEEVERGKKRMPLMAFFGLLAALLAAYVMSYFGLAWGVVDWIGAIELAFWCWIGFSVPPLLGVVLWESKPFKLFAINSLYWLVSFIAMALILVR